MSKYLGEAKEGVIYMFGNPFSLGLGIVVGDIAAWESTYLGLGFVWGLSESRGDRPYRVKLGDIGVEA